MTEESGPALAIEQAKPTAGELSLYHINRSIRRCTIGGFMAIAVCFGGLGTWAALAPLESAVVAAGIVVVEGQRKTVQHLEGGIIREIVVQEGDTVRANDVLVRLDDTVTRASLDLVQGRFYAALAERARLEAERDGGSAVKLPPDLAEKVNDTKIRALLNSQSQIFKARRTSREGQISILDQQIRQFEDEIAGLRTQVAAGDRQIGFIAEELEIVQKLFEKGIETKRRLLSLGREDARLAGQRGALLAEIAEASRNIGQKRLEKIQVQNTFRDEVVGRLRDVHETILELHEHIRAAADKLARGNVRAPQGGIVVGLRFHNSGGVIGPGDAILDIVPQESKLVIESKVQPDDIDSVHLGLPAAIHLTAYSSRNSPMIDGEVVYVSADRLTDERTGAPYYLARIRIDPGALKDNPEMRPAPGMAASVMIRTGARTVFDYAVDPLTYSLKRAFREE